MGWLPTGRLLWEWREPQISPLRFAPVEMTKGGAVADREVAMGMVRTADLATALRSGRDDKG
jgi:hypothetical protein